MNGVCWSTIVNPSISDMNTVDGIGAAQFVSNLTGLTAGTTYHVRAYAINSVGTAYGADMSFSTLGSAPESITQPATNISTVEATLNGTVNANYLSTIVTFEYGISTSYGKTVTATQSPVTGNSISNVSIGLTGLTAGTTYHYRIKTVNSLGTQYGEDMSFTTLGQVASSLTQSATNITTSGCTLNGTINPNYLLTTIVFEYGTTATYGNTITASQSPVSGNTIMIATADLAGLAAGTTYHFRIKTVNNLGTVYGEDKTFATLGQAPSCIPSSATNITTTFATLNGTVNPNYLSTTVTFEYGTTANYGQTVPAIPSPISGNNYTNVSANISSLTLGTTYHFRIKAVNAIGTTYSGDMTLATPAQVPSSITSPATNVSSTMAILNGIVNANNVSTTVTFDYGTTTNYGSSITASQSPVTGSNGTTVNGVVSGLQFGTTYHYRVKAVNSIGTTYGNDVSFTTLNVPTVTTTPVTSILDYRANSGGNISSDGGAAIIARGVCWNILGNPTISDNKTTNGTGIGSFSSSITGLIPSTTYYVRAYATNEVGTSYGNQFSFTTLQWPTSGLLARWTFENSLRDSGPNGYNLTGTAAYFTGLVGNALNASEVYNNNTTLKSFINNNNTWTISFWFRTNGTLSNNVQLPLFAVDGPNTYPYQRIWIIINKWNSTTKMSLHRYNASTMVYGDLGAYFGSAFTNLDNSAWHHVVACYTGSNVLFYIDNTPVTYFTPDNSTNPNWPLYIGASMGTTNATAVTICGNQQNNLTNFNGLVDQVYIYSRVLTTNEISTLYNNGAGL